MKIKEIKTMIDSKFFITLHAIDKITDSKLRDIISLDDRGYAWDEIRKEIQYIIRTEYEGSSEKNGEIAVETLSGVFTFLFDKANKQWRLVNYVCLDNY